MQIESLKIVKAVTIQPKLYSTINLTDNNDNNNKILK